MSPTATVLPFVAGTLAIAGGLTLARLLRGPSAVDRLLALDTLYVLAMAGLVLSGVAFSNTLYFELALLIGALGFIGTVAAARYLLRGGVAE